MLSTYTLLEMGVSAVMDYVEALLCLLFQVGESVRTKIQKIMYFASQKGLIEDTFIPHYYGPYSREVADTTESLVSIGFLREDIRLFREGMGYKYSLTEDGKLVLEDMISTKISPENYAGLSKIAETCKDATPILLSIAAKVHFILKQKNEPMTPEQICEHAKGLNWEITSEQIEAACELLKKLELVE